MKTIWIGPQGLRSGWAIAMFAALLVIGFFAASAAVSYVSRFAPVTQSATPGPVAGGNVIGPGDKLESEGILTAIVLVATWIMALIERRPFGSYGLGGRLRFWRFLWGGAVGFLMLSLLMGVLIAGGWMLGERPHSPPLIGFEKAGVWLVAYFLTGVFEETLFRGYVLCTLDRGIGFWWAALILSVVFALAHGQNAGESPVGLVSAALIALVFCFSLKRTGSLWWAIGFHSFWDWGETFFYGTASSGARVSGHLFTSTAAGNPLLSGGTTGPEGSLIVFLPIVLAAVALYILTRPRRTRISS